jgi:hypothetical protein
MNKQARVTIVVQGGVVQTVHNPSDMVVEIIDFDNPSREIYGHNSDDVCPQTTLDEIEKAIRNQTKVEE